MKAQKKLLAISSGIQKKKAKAQKQQNGEQLTEKKPKNSRWALFLLLLLIGGGGYIISQNLSDEKTTAVGTVPVDQDKLGSIVDLDALKEYLAKSTDLEKKKLIKERIKEVEIKIDDKWEKAAMKTIRKPFEISQSYVQLIEVENLR